MKLSLIASVSAFTVTDTRVARDIEEKGEKRYSQLHDMMFHYNSEFDEKKYWSYGCHCFVLGESILTVFSVLEARNRKLKLENRKLS